MSGNGIPLILLFFSSAVLLTSLKNFLIVTCVALDMVDVATDMLVRDVILHMVIVVAVICQLIQMLLD